MGFEVDPDAYGRFMGRFSVPLAAEFLVLVDPEPGQSALDVGCGTGALTGELVRRLGASSVAAVDPSERFVASLRDRLPEVDVRRAKAEALPFPDDRFDLALAQLVVHFMDDPVRALGEMARVTRPGGRVAACVWDHAGGRGPLATFWRAVRELDPQAPDESELPGVREGHLVEILGQAGLRDVESAILTVRVAFADIDDWWAPYTLGVGPAGEYVAGLDGPRREALRARCTELLPTGPFTVGASAWTAVGRA